MRCGRSRWIMRPAVSCYELEFTTLLKELAPAADNSVISYNLKPTKAEVAALLEEARAIDSKTKFAARDGAGYF